MREGGVISVCLCVCDREREREILLRRDSLCYEVVQNSGVVLML